jgi:predicted ATP-grasp superfamily ATP-dependent carboligase
VEIYTIPQLRNPIMLIAFAGWSDAGDAATGVLNHLLEELSPSKEPLQNLMAEIESDEYYDFQVNRPTVQLDNQSIRSLRWPGVEIFALKNPKGDRDFIVVRGVEPSMKWRSFADEILDFAEDCEVSLTISLGSMLADIPHTRPIPVSGTAAHPKIAERLGIEVSRYEGPTGIMAVIQDGCVNRDIEALALWSAIPHYGHATPSPKAMLALLNGLEDFLEISLPQGELSNQSALWESELNQLVTEDSDLVEYVKALEEARDSSDGEDTGEELAREVERFLRRENARERDLDS